MYGEYGGLEKTRTSDLFRVKEAKSITYRCSSMRTRDLQVGDLDLKWTAGGLSGSSGPHVDLIHAQAPQHLQW
jgi:hypothetical protein